MLSITATVAGKPLTDIQLSGRQEKETDAICAMQDRAAETRTQGVEQGRTRLDDLMSSKSPLDRFRDDGPDR
jgi:hypothetical protein